METVEHTEKIIKNLTSSFCLVILSLAIWYKVIILQNI